MTIILDELFSHQRRHSCTNLLSALMNITEVSVIQVAREWAARHGQDDAQAVLAAADAIGKIKSRFTGDEYQSALESLYQHYAQA